MTRVPFLRVLAVTTFAVLALPSCAVFRGTPEVESSVVLGPGGRAEGHVVVPQGAKAEIELENKGPGRADYVIRTKAGEKLASGALREASVGLVAGEPTVVVVVLETYEDAGTTVEYEVETTGGVNVEWDLSRAFRAATK